MTDRTLMIPNERIERAILLVRGHRVMLDQDLAILYGVETKYLKRRANRNVERFPQDFMLRLTRQELARPRRQIGTLNGLGRGRYSKYLPYALTEHGILMLSSVLNSPRAVQVNIAIMRTFVKLCEILSGNKELAHKFSELERKVGDHDVVIRNIILYSRTSQIVMIQSLSSPKSFVGDPARCLYGLDARLKHSGMTKSCFVALLSITIRKMLDQPSKPKGPIGFHP